MHGANASVPKLWLRLVGMRTSRIRVSPMEARGVKSSQNSKREVELLLYKTIKARGLGWAGGSSVTGASLASPNAKRSRSRAISGLGSRDARILRITSTILPPVVRRATSGVLSPLHDWLGVVCYAYSSSTSTPVSTQLHFLRNNMPMPMTRHRGPLQRHCRGLATRYSYGFYFPVNLA